MKKVALITGASTGIGREMALLHAEHGGDLVLVARNEDKLNELAHEVKEIHKREAVVLPKDLTKKEASKELFDKVTAENIVVDFLINNAGFGGIGKFNEQVWSNNLAMIQLNIIALSELTHLFLQPMVERNSGKILNVSSTASLMPGPLQAVYFATKAYVTSFSNALAEELKDTSVTVTNLMPGATETEFAKVSGMDKTELFAKTASAKEVALDGYKGMMEGKLDVLSGLTFSQRIMMKSIPFAPKKVLLAQIRKMQEVNE